MTVTAANQCLNGLFRSAWLSLHTTDPMDSGESTEVGTRQALAVEAAVGGAVRNHGRVEFEGLPDAAITHVGVWDAEDGGSLIWSAPLPGPKRTNEGDTFRVPPRFLTFALN